MKINIHKEGETDQNEKAADKPSEKLYLASPLIVDDQDIAKYLGYSVLMIVRKDRKYDSIKPRIRVIDFNVCEGGLQTSSHVFHSYSFKD